MNVIVDFCLVPIGTSVSLSPYVAACEAILAAAGLKTALHANGTNIEGEWDAVFAAINTSTTEWTVTDGVSSPAPFCCVVGPP